MKIVPVPAVQKPNNDLQKELDFYHKLGTKAHLKGSKESSTVVHLNQQNIKIGYEHLYTYSAQK